MATDTARVLESASGHLAPVTCLALSPDGSTLVTGSRDATAILWRIHGNSATTTNTGSSTMADPGLVAAAAAAAAGGSSIAEGGEGNSSVIDSRRRRVEGPLHVLRGHVDELVCCCVHADLDLVVTSSRTKGVLLHSITRGRYLRRLPVHHADLVAVSAEGIIVVFDKVSRVLQTFTVNGALIVAKLLPSWEGNVSSIEISKDGLYAVIGTSCGRPLPSTSSLTPGKGLSTSDSGRYASQHSPQWAAVGPCPSCGEKLGNHSSDCSLSKINRQFDEQARLERSDSRGIRPPIGLRSEGSIVMRRSESGLIRYTSNTRQSDDLQRSESGKGKTGSGIRQSEESGGVRRGDSGGSMDSRPHVEPQPAIILLELYTLEVRTTFILLNRCVFTIGI